MTRQRRLCMVVHAPYPKAETRVEREAHAALEAGWDVDVVALREPGEPATEVTARGIRIYRLPTVRTRGGGASTVLREYVGFTLQALLKVTVLHRRRRYAVVQIHNPPDFLVLAGFLPKLMGARLVLDIHDLAPEMFEMRFAGRRWSGLATRVLRRVERLALGTADAVVTVHEPYRRLLLQRGVPPDKLTVALNTPEERLIPDEAPAADPAVLRIVYHGTITPHYGLDVLVEAFSAVAAELPEATVEIYGAGDALPGVKNQVARLGLADRFWFSDRFLDNDEVLLRVRGASIGVISNLPIPRNQAALPTKLFEYAALGIPIVSSRLDAIAEYFDETEIAYFDAGDPRSLGRALLETARDPETASVRARRARGRYESYRWGVSSAEYLALLERLLRRR
jgi:glycosyltransferase involved in cell wall biosynthesis